VFPVWYGLPTECICVFCMVLTDYATVSASSINRLIFVMGTQCAFCEVASGSSNMQANERPIRVSRCELALFSSRNCSALSWKCHTAIYHVAYAPTQDVGLSRGVILDYVSHIA
jgi:hypothetical protein